MDEKKNRGEGGNMTRKEGKRERRNGKVEERKRNGEVRLSRDPRWSSERSTHLQAKVEIGAFNALDAQARDVLLAIGAVVFRIQI